jgi:hypothetical protein
MKVKEREPAFSTLAPSGIFFFFVIRNGEEEEEEDDPSPPFVHPDFDTRTDPSPAFFTPTSTPGGGRPLPPPSFTPNFTFRVY